MLKLDYAKPDKQSEVRRLKVICVAVNLATFVAACLTFYLWHRHWMRTERFYMNQAFLYPIWALTIWFYRRVNHESQDNDNAN